MKRLHLFSLVSAMCVVAMMAGCASTPDKISSMSQFLPPSTSGTVTVTPAVLKLENGTTTTDLVYRNDAQLAPLPVQLNNPTLVKDLQATAANLDQAVAIGALPKDDPAAPCVHDFLQRAGVENAPGLPVTQSFKPDNAGVFSAGSILYILAQQAKAAARAGGIQISQQCLALVGQIHLDAITATAKGAARLLPVSIPGIGLR